MKINFNEIREQTVPAMNGGTGQMSARMHIGPKGKIITTRLHQGASIGMHRHLTSDDINYVLSGTGRAVCDGEEEILTAGCCHICPKGSEHSIINSGDDELVLFTVVVER